VCVAAARLDLQREQSPSRLTRVIDDLYVRVDAVVGHRLIAKDPSEVPIDDFADDVYAGVADPPS